MAAAFGRIAFHYSAKAANFIIRNTASFLSQDLTRSPSRGTLDFEVSVDLSEVRRYLTRLERRGVPKAAARSLNRTASSTRTAARRIVAQEMGIAQKHIKRGFSVHKASQKRLSAAVVGKGQPVELYKFKGTRETKTRGVVSNAYGERKRYPGAFIATMPNGKTGVFVRKTRKRLPIRKVWGPSVPATMAEDAAQQAMQEKAQETWEKEFPRQLRFYIERAKRKAT
jgi:hypothetical protein